MTTGMHLRVAKEKVDRYQAVLLARVFNSALYSKLTLRDKRIMRAILLSEKNKEIAMKD